MSEDCMVEGFAAEVNPSIAFGSGSPPHELRSQGGTQDDS